MISMKVVVALLLISWPCARALWQLVWRPYQVARSFGRQVIHGPPYRFAVGSLPECRRMLIAGRSNSLDPRSHNYSSLVHPFFQKWAHDYGKTFLYWLGPIPSICSTDMEPVKQVLAADRTNLFEKDYCLNPRLEIVLGKGLILLNGDDWKRHRKVLHPVFNQENLKIITPYIVIERSDELLLTQLREMYNHEGPLTSVIVPTQGYLALSRQLVGNVILICTSGLR